MNKIIIASLALILSSPAYAVKCSDFNTQAAAQRYHNQHGGQTRLDRDQDGEACECLPGGSKYGTSTCARR